MVFLYDPSLERFSFSFMAVTSSRSLRNTYGLRLHLYADDSQIYGSCRPSAYMEQRTRISACIDDVADWMRCAGTAFSSTLRRPRLSGLPQVVIYSPCSYRRLHYESALITLCMPSVVVRDLGILLDADVSMKPRVMQPASSCCGSCDPSVVQCHDPYSSHW